MTEATGRVAAPSVRSISTAVDSIARNHLIDIEQRIASLQSLKAELSRMMDECGHGRVCDCRIIEVLADHDQCITEHAH